MVVVEAAAGLADRGEDPVDDDRGDRVFAGLAVDESVGPVEVRSGLDQGCGDACGAGDRQAAGFDRCRQRGEGGEAAGERDLAPRQAGLLRVEPAGGRGGVGEGVQGAGVDVGDAAEHDRAQDLQLLQQHLRLGDGLRTRQLDRHLHPHPRHRLHERAQRQGPGVRRGAGRRAGERSGRRLRSLDPGSRVRTSAVRSGEPLAQQRLRLRRHRAVADGTVAEQTAQHVVHPLGRSRLTADRHRRHLLAPSRTFVRSLPLRT